MKYLYTGESLHNSYTIVASILVCLVCSLFSIAPTPGLEDDFASCGEDGTVRVWKG